MSDVFIFPYRLDKKCSRYTKMEFDFKSLKTKLNQLKTLRGYVLMIVEQIYTKLDKMEIVYRDMVSNVGQEKFFITGIDNYYFQTMFIKTEYEHVLMSLSMLSNRIYYDYYSMFKELRNYVLENIKEKRHDNDPAKKKT